jgi:RimJ/RimL family protein N-acetyltransferase
MNIKPILLNLPMPIITPRLVLRPPQPGDGIAVNQAVLESFETLKEFMPWAQIKPSVDESEEFARTAASNWILKQGDLPLFMFDKQTNEFIGGTGYHHVEWEIPCLQIGYWIRNSRSGEGLMTEAVNALTQYAFKQLHAKRIEIRCDIDNIPSKKIPERLCYQLEATLKASRIKPNGAISDTLIYTCFDVSKLPPLEVEWNLESIG